MHLSQWGLRAHVGAVSAAERVSTMASEPHSDSFPALACALDRDEQIERQQGFSALMARGLLTRDQIDRGLLLRFQGLPEIEVALRDLVQRERECCPFLRFGLAPQGSELWLRVEAPDEGRELLATLFPT